MLCLNSQLKIIRHRAGESISLGGGGLTTCRDIASAS